MVKNKTKNLALLIICSVILTGCSGKVETKTEYIEKPVYVQVPVLEKPKIKPLPKPVLEISKLTDKSPPSKVAEAYYNTVQQLLKYTNLLEKQLSPFYEEYKKWKN